MTTETDLPPSSVAAFTEALKGARGSLDAWLEVNDESEVAAHIEAYASACVSSATAEKDAEIEALRAEVDQWKRRAGAYFQTAERQGKSAERLAEALRYAEAFISVAVPQLARDRDEAINEVLPAIRAALRDHDQEDRND